MVKCVECKKALPQIFRGKKAADITVIIVIFYL